MRLLDLAVAVLVIGAFIGVYRLFAEDMRRGNTSRAAAAQGGTDGTVGRREGDSHQLPAGRSIVDAISGQVSAWLDSLLPNSRTSPAPQRDDDCVSWSGEAETSDAFDEPPPPAPEGRAGNAGAARVLGGHGPGGQDVQDGNTAGIPQSQDASGNVAEVPLPALTPSLAPTRWQHIVLHHSGTTRGNAAIFDRYHRKERKLADGLIYHFVIGNGTDSADGAIEEGPRWLKGIAGPQTRKKDINDGAIGVCLVGNFDESAPSEAQMNVLRALIRYLCETYSIPAENVLPRSAVPGERISSPGKSFTLPGRRP